MQRSGQLTGRRWPKKQKEGTAVVAHDARPPRRKRLRDGRVVWRREEEIFLIAFIAEHLNCQGGIVILKQHFKFVTKILGL